MQRAHLAPLQGPGCAVLVLASTLTWDRHLATGAAHALRWPRLARAHAGGVTPGEHRSAAASTLVHGAATLDDPVLPEGLAAFALQWPLLLFASGYVALGMREGEVMETASAASCVCLVVVCVCIYDGPVLLGRPTEDRSAFSAVERVWWQLGARATACPVYRESS